MLHHGPLSWLLYSSGGVEVSLALAAWADDLIRWAAATAPTAVMGAETGVMINMMSDAGMLRHARAKASAARIEVANNGTRFGGRLNPRISVHDEVRRCLRSS